MHILQSFCIAMSLSFFRHNKTPKVFCLTFGVHVIGEPSFLMCCQNYFWFFLASAFFVTSNMIGVAMKIEA